MQNKVERYFNAPIQLYKGFVLDCDTCLFNIVRYACFEYTIKNDCTIKDAVNFYGINIGDNTKSNLQRAFEIGKELHEKIPINSPMVGINKEVFFKYKSEDKTEFEKICLLAYLSIKSIVQNKSYCKIDNKFLLSRMDGNPSVIDLNKLSPEIKKHSKEYQLVKIKNELIKSWNLKHYSRYTRGFYVSFSMELEDLIYEAEKKRKTYLEKLQKELQKVAVAKALDKLKNTTITRP